MSRIRPRGWLLAACLLAVAVPPATAQSPTPGAMPPPPGMDLAASAAMRFPQPVRAGDLIGRAVLRPVESQDRIGTVRALVRDPIGTVEAIVDLGGLLGFGARPIAVPIDALVLLGDVIEVAAFTPKQLQTFPTFQPGATQPVAPDTILRIGLAKPSH